ncbi:MAG: hypothetical protein MUE46_20325 [Xanthomonadales bacterium]|nr:hypothetical protein [Xanthomonadales bacterium]
MIARFRVAVPLGDAEIDAVIADFEALRRGASRADPGDVLGDAEIHEVRPSRTSMHRSAAFRERSRVTSDAGLARSVRAVKS